MKLIMLGEGKFAEVSDSMYEFLNQFEWGCSQRYPDRVVRGANGAWTVERMHHLIAGYPLKGFVVDHVDGDTLNNQIENLKIVTARQNPQNPQNYHLYNSGRLVGPTYDKLAKKWKARITIVGKTFHLGDFETEQLAHEAYLEALVHFRQFGVKLTLDD